MCTAITFKTKSHYFGRNLDLDISYNETVTVMPRNFPIHLRKMPSISSHFAMIGMATVIDGIPLYYDATNEKGLSIAALNFPGNAVYHEPVEGKHNVTPFELIPYLLAQCTTVSEVRTLLQSLNITDIPFTSSLPLTPLHWIIADRDETVTVESTADGLRVYDNPVGVLTNNPPFDYHLYNLSNYLNLTPEVPENRFASNVDLTPYSRGMGAIGLPGDLSSASRFVRASFMKSNAVCAGGEKESVNQFFHILTSVTHPRGAVRLKNGKYQITVYSSCCNVDKGIYYFTTYENRGIRGIDMNRENLDGDKPISYGINHQEDFAILN